MYHKQLTT